MHTGAEVGTTLLILSLSLRNSVTKRPTCGPLLSQVLYSTVEEEEAGVTPIQIECPRNLIESENGAGIVRGCCN